MLIGQSVICPTSAATYYTPWMPRQGDKFSVQIEVIRSSGAGITFNCVVETKNNEDSDSAPTVLSPTLAVTVTAGTVTDGQYSGALELVRYKYTISATSEQWLHFRANPPIWYPN